MNSIDRAFLNEKKVQHLRELLQRAWEQLDDLRGDAFHPSQDLSQVMADIENELDIPKDQRWE